MSLPASEATPTETPEVATSQAGGGDAGGPASGTVSSAGEGTGRLTKTGPLVCLVMVAGAAVLLFIASHHAFAGNSDGATVILQGQAVLHGDLGLSGWALSLDSFWTVDVPFYVVGVAINGVGPAIYHGMPAVIAALVGGVVAGIRLRSVRGALPAVTAGLGSLVADVAVRRIMDKVGTYTIGSANPTASRDQMLHNVANAAS